MGMNLCRGCGLTFGTLKSFETHRTGSYGEPIFKASSIGKSRQVSGHTPPTRRCMTLSEIQALGMTQDSKGWWMLPRRLASPAHEEEAELEKATS
jgi:hypothetical protein